LVLVEVVVGEVVELAHPMQRNPHRHLLKFNKPTKFKLIALRGTVSRCALQYAYNMW
jgi:hypothetical protein